ncbi:MAG TPA: outer membrane beta-barrel protein, partial [Burkholderiales bacterium]|nr:outer membrane beta-barrel protein [Burkholderiales bacterium]
AATAFSGVAAAQSMDMSAFYIGGSIGQSELKDACEGVASCDEKDTAWRFIAGYQINKNFAAEVGYTDLGEASAPGASAEASAWELVGLGFLPLGNHFSLYGKAGVYRGDVEASGLGVSVEESNNGLTYGAGVQWDFGKRLGLRAEWQRYADVGGDDVGGETDVDVMNIGVVFRFQ